MKKIVAATLLLLMAVAMVLPTSAFADVVYCEWSAYGCNYKIIVPNGGGEGGPGVGVINYGDGWVPYGSGTAGSCP